MIMKRSQNISLVTMSLLIIIVTSNLRAQKPAMKYGKIDPAYFEMKAYDKDTSAEALILGDYGESQIVYNQNDGFVVEYSRHFRAKVFKKSGYNLANQELILYHNSHG